MFSRLSELRGNKNFIQFNKYPGRTFLLSVFLCKAFSDVIPAESKWVDYINWNKRSSEMVSGLSGNDRAVIKNNQMFCFWKSLSVTSCSPGTLQSPSWEAPSSLKAIGCGCWVVNPLWLSVFWLQSFGKNIMSDHFSDINGKWFTIVRYWATRFAYRIFLSKADCPSFLIKATVNEDMTPALRTICKAGWGKWSGFVA